MLGITDPFTFILGTIIIVLLPGPNSLYVALVASKRGVRPAFTAAAGIFTGDSVLMVLAILGAATLVQGYPNLFSGIKLLGAAYLAFLGFQLLRDVYRTHVAKAPPESLATPFRSALTIGLLNPKAILFFASFFVQFLDPTYEQPWLTFAALFVLVQLISQTYLASLIAITLYFKERLHADSLWRRALSVLVALFFFYFALSIVIDALG